MDWLKGKSDEGRKLKNLPVSNYDDIVKRLSGNNKKGGQVVKSLVDGIRKKRAE